MRQMMDVISLVTLLDTEQSIKKSYMLYAKRRISKRDQLSINAL
jgi:hypothetical protein